MCRLRRSREFLSPLKDYLEIISPRVTSLALVNWCAFYIAFSVCLLVACFTSGLKIRHVPMYRVAWYFCFVRVVIDASHGVFLVVVA